MRDEIVAGVRTLAAHPVTPSLALTTTALLLLFEGFAEVIVVGLALHVLELSTGGGRFPAGGLGVGAVGAGVGLVLLLDRGRLVIGIAGGSLLIGAWGRYCRGWSRSPPRLTPAGSGWGSGSSSSRSRRRR